MYPYIFAHMTTLFANSLENFELNCMTNKFHVQTPELLILSIYQLLFFAKTLF